MTKKILSLLRVNNNAQGFEPQRADMQKWLGSLGYQPDEIEWLECVASARTPNTEYSQMLDDIKRLTTDGGIKAVAVWDITRLGRSKSDLLRLKMFLIEHQVQLLVKNPAIKLLNDNGAVSPAANSLFTECAKMADTELSQ